MIRLAGLALVLMAAPAAAQFGHIPYTTAKATAWQDADGIRHEVISPRCAILIGERRTDPRCATHEFVVRSVVERFPVCCQLEPRLDR